ncbi:Na(+)/citrate cotransporter-like [Amblyomma americanum]
MQVVAIVLHWQFVWMTFLYRYDAPQTVATRAAIRMTIRKRSSELGVVTFADFVQVILIGIWVAIYCTLFTEATFNGTEYEKLEMDFFVVLALLSLPWGRPEHPTTESLRPLVQRIPWSTIFAYGSTFTLSFIVKSTKFVTWLRETLMTLENHNRLLPQAFLTVCASMMAELVSSCHTVRILLPVAFETAVAEPCNPLYYALPITVAASSPVILPTARVSIALLSELTDIGPLSMLLYGLLLKALIITCVLISVDTLGYLMFDWSALPSWMMAHHMNISHEWHPGGRLP